MKAAINRNAGVRITGTAPLGGRADFEAYIDSRGEPYRQGMTIAYYDDRNNRFTIFLERDEVAKLRDVVVEVLK